ncbi:hypothetical protein BDY24DRAFT_415134 [Mrakia frigida]|uniref:uncharacterized protein n=1 Tax=Mrakia frigida TaxID=29902 RepID=UPI003FCBF778
MSQCFTDPTLTLFGTTIFAGEPGSPIYSTSTYYVTVEGTPIPYETSTCDGGYKGGYTDACSHYSTYTAFSTGPPVTSTLYDVITVAPEAGGSITSTFPTETRYTTSCTTAPDPGNGGTTPTAPATPTTPQAATTPTPPPSVVTPSTVVSVGVSSSPITITNSNGLVSISVQVQSVSIVFTSNVAAAATGISALNATNSPSSSIGPIIGGVVGGIVVLGAIFALIFFLRRKNKNNGNNNDDDYDDVYGTVRRSTDRGDKVERKRMDLAEEDPNPGFVQPFTQYTAPSSNTNQQQEHTYPSNTQAPNSSFSPIPTCSASPPPQQTSHQYNAFAAGYNNSQSPPASITSAQAKALEAQGQRSRSAQGGPSGAGNEEEVVVHEDAGPVNNRVDLPPVYVDRS